MLDKNFSIITALSNLLFYLGIISVFYFGKLGENTPKFLISYFCIIVGLIGTLLTDSVINAGTKGISIPVFRVTILLKEAILILLFVVIRKSLYVAVCGMVGLFVVDIFLEGILIRQMDRSQITIKEFLLQDIPVDPKALSNVRRYYWVNIIFVFLFLFIHEKWYETIIMLALALLVHSITLRKTITGICEFTGVQEKTWNHIKVILWFIELAGLAMAYFDVDKIVICVLFSYYYMIITDCANPQRTSVVRIDRTEKRRKKKRVSDKIID